MDGLINSEASCWSAHCFLELPSLCCQPEDHVSLVVGGNNQMIGSLTQMEISAGQLVGVTQHCAYKSCVLLFWNEVIVCLLDVARQRESFCCCSEGAVL